MSQRILLVGGGSGGHLFPLVAVWREIRRMHPEARGHFVCTERPEDREYLKSEGCPINTLPVIRRSWHLPVTFWQAYKTANTLMKEYQPDVVFSKGGAVSVPVCLAAKKRKIPIVLHESDAVMGRANRMIAKWATTVCLGFKDPSVQCPVSSVETGNPVREQILRGDKKEGLRLTGFSGKKPVLLVFGGSQGSVTLNDWVRMHLVSLLAVADVIHLTGRGKHGAGKHNGYFSVPFAKDELPHLYALADLAVSRAGGGNISELAACGIPAILVPLRGLAQDHQEHNARLAEASGGCIVVEQEQRERLLPELLDLLAHPAKRSRMAEAVRTLYRPDACLKIAEAVIAATR